MSDIFRFDLLGHVEVSTTPDFFKCCPSTCSSNLAGFLHILVKLTSELKSIYKVGQTGCPTLTYILCRELCKSNDYGEAVFKVFFSLCCSQSQKN